MAVDWSKVPPGTSFEFDDVTPSAVIGSFGQRQKETEMWTLLASSACTAGMTVGDFIGWSFGVLAIGLGIGGAVESRVRRLR